MPKPESSMLSTASAPSARSATRIWPPGGVYLTALVRMFVSTCSIRTASPSIHAGSVVTSMCRSSRGSAANVSAARRTTSARSSGCRFNRIFPEFTRSMSSRSSIKCVMWSTCRAITSCARVSGLLLGVPHLEHSGGSADRSERIAQLVGQQCQELVFHAAVVLGTVAVAVGLEKLRHVRHDQVPAIAVGRPGRGERQTHLEGT